MDYLKDYYFLKNIYKESENNIILPGNQFVIKNVEFMSESSDIFPEISDYIKKNAENKNKINSISSKKKSECSNILRIFDFIDPIIKENTSFIYPVYKKNENKKAGSVIILLHGLNEKSWDKYHTWAKKLVELTGKSVIMFPISFHINRAPLEWTEPRKMNAVSKERKNIFPDIIETSFVNAAISTRLQYAPQTFFWSGLRTYFDILKLINQIKNDEHEYIDRNASIDFFSYSIGAFLTEILLVADDKGLFNNSRAFLFCGGPTMDAMYPVSKYIYDNKTEAEMISFYVKNFDASLKSDSSLNNYFIDDNSAGIAFKAMLNYENLRLCREDRFRKLSENICALALEKDSVIPPVSVKKTLNGIDNDIPVRVYSMDFPFEYDHVSPFPLNEHIQTDVNISFNKVFEIAGNFLK